MTGRVNGDTAIITGAAQGIGKAIAQKLGEEGATIVIADRQENKAKRTAMEFNEQGIQTKSVLCDVTDRNDVAELVATTKSLFGNIDILVNNAGIGWLGSFVDMNPSEWDRILDVNLTGPFNCCHEVVPEMIQNQYGRIVNIASMAGRNISYHGGANYTASKWGVIGFTKHLAWDLGQHNITVNAVCPGSTKTEMTDTETTPEQRANTERKIPIGRWAKPKDHAHGVLYFVAESGEYITGTVLEIDGGKQLSVRNEL